MKHLHEMYHILHITFRTIKLVYVEETPNISEDFLVTKWLLQVVAANIKCMADFEDE